MLDKADTLYYTGFYNDSCCETDSTSGLSRYYHHLQSSLLTVLSNNEINVAFALVVVVLRQNLSKVIYIINITKSCRKVTVSKIHE